MLLSKKLVPHAVVPERKTAGSAGMDLVASESVFIDPGEWKVVPTSLAMSIPQGFVGFICPRSGLAAKQGLTVLNAPGVVDSDFRGECRVILVNHGSIGQLVRAGDRIAQLVVLPYLLSSVREVDELDSTERGEGGFGSTGK